MSQAVRANTVKRTEDITAAVTKKPEVEVSEPNRLPAHAPVEQGWPVAVGIVEGVCIDDPRLSLGLEGNKGRGGENDKWVEDL